MLIPRLPSPTPDVGVRPASPAPAEDVRDRTAALLDRTLPLRCLLITVATAALGGVAMSVLLPLCPPEALAEVLNAHLPADGTLTVLFWLRLCAAQLPVCLLLSLAGLTRFSGGLTTAVLGFRGLAEGAAMYLLCALWRGALAWPSPLPVAWVVGAYGLWVLLNWVSRHWLAAEARRFPQTVARLESTLPEGTDAARARLRYVLWRYLAVCLAALCMTFAACGVYTAMLI